LEEAWREHAEKCVTLVLDNDGLVRQFISGNKVIWK